MRKTLLLLLGIGVAGFAGYANAASNLGSTAIPVFEGHRLTPITSGPRVLYCPSEEDDPVYRARIAAWIGGTCDYFDARFATPSLAELAGYNGVMTWTDYPYFDNVAMGNVLADFVDLGGHVVLGAFCAYTMGNYLAGRIMTDTSRYCPVTGGSNHFSMSMWDGSCGEGPVHAGITSYGACYRDYLTLVNGSICGRFQDGEIANAINGSGGVISRDDVVYANGAGGYPYCASTGQDPERVANALAGGTARTDISGIASTSSSGRGQGSLPVGTTFHSRSRTLPSGTVSCSFRPPPPPGAGSACGNF